MQSTTPPTELDAEARKRPPIALPVLDDDGPGREKPRRPLTSRPIFWIGLAALIAALIGGFLYWQDARRFESTDDAYVDAHIVRVSPQTSGRLTAVPAQDNQHVKPGDLLAVIDPAELNASLQNAEAQLAEARGQLAQAEAEREQVRANIAAAEATRGQQSANVGVPGAQVERARRDLARYLQLQREQPSAVAQTTIDAARAELNVALAQEAAARASVRNAGANIGATVRQLASAEAAIKAAQAKVEAAQSRVDTAQITQNYGRIVAPIAGVVANRNVNVGSYVTPQSQLMAIVPDHMWVTANFKETQLAGMRVGQPVDIKVDAIPNVLFRGHIESFQRGAGQAFQLLPAQNATGNFVKVVQRVPVRIAFDSPDPLKYPIGPGMSVVPKVRVRD
ncbi:MAG: HlyD family secretion protein [Sphingomonadaceae bacterium]|nr:HlyD family secretion protein [Sphingomonadaceae bacterium]